MLHNVSEKPICAWLSRHAPTPAQRNSLANYRIIQLPNRWDSAETAWRTAKERCGGQPALAVVVMPEDMLCEFISLAKGTEIIRPKMGVLDHEHWSGVWQQVYVYPKTGYKPWEPARP